MADIRKLAPLILKWEGKFADDPADAGGPTYMGITLKTLIRAGFDKNKDGLLDVKDLIALNEHDVIYYFLKPFYWDRWQADKIQNQSIANLLVDWVWMSGKVGITIPQDIIGVKVDGIVGDKTLMAINQFKEPSLLFEKLKEERKMYIERICKARLSNRRFKQGWLNRLEDFRFGCIILLFVVCFGWGGCKSTAQPGLFVTDTVQTSTDSVTEKKQHSLSTDVYQNHVYEEVLDAIFIVKADSLPVSTSFKSLIPNTSSEGILIYSKKRVYSNKSGQQQSTVSDSQITAKQSVENNQLNTAIRHKKEKSSLYIVFILSLIAFMLILLIRFIGLFRK